VALCVFGPGESRRENRERTYAFSVVSPSLRKSS